MNVQDTISGIVVSVIGLAALAVLVSSRARTASVIQASSSGLANVIGAAVSPVSNAGGGNLSVPITMPVPTFNN